MRVEGKLELKFLEQCQRYIDRQMGRHVGVCLRPNSTHARQTHEVLKCKTQWPQADPNRTLICF